MYFGDGGEKKLQQAELTELMLLKMDKF